MALFEIRKRSHRPNYSLNTPAGADFARGMAFQESAVAGNTELADGTNALVGFVTRITLQTGPILDDAIYPNRIELPFKSGEEGSFEYGEEIEAEGGAGSAAAAQPSYVQTAGVGLIGAATPLKSPLSFQAGLWAVGQAGQICEFILEELMKPEIAGNVRIRARRLAGAIKA